jgi:hypothetical protein
MLKTTDPDFVRDESSFALINTNVNAYKQYKLARANKLAVASNEQKIKELETEVSELKTLVRELLKEKNG